MDTKEWLNKRAGEFITRVLSQHFADVYKRAHKNISSSRINNKCYNIRGGSHERSITNRNKFDINSKFRF